MTKVKDGIPKLAVLTTFFNPNNYLNLRYNYLKFSEKIKEKADLFPIELSFNGEFFIEDENVIQIKGSRENILWQKERLLNIALENLPKEYTNVAWIDCDIIFENENWVEEVNEKLKDYKVLQLYSTITRLNADGDKISSQYGSIKRISYKNIIKHGLNGTSGFAWAIRREVIDKIKFLDTMIIGSGDSLMWNSFYDYKNPIYKKSMNYDWYENYLNWAKNSFNEINSSVSFIDGNINHLYHGDIKNRNYIGRFDILKKYNFNIKEDLKIDSNKVWKIKRSEITNALVKYFIDRKEDDIIRNDIIKNDIIKDNKNILRISKRDSSINPKLAVLTTFFNPNNYLNLRYNYLKFSEKIKEKADLFPIELSFNGEFFIEDENVIQIKGSRENILWQKERLLNIALENLPKEYTNVAWIDCDIIFENENWVEEVNEKLKDYKVLQLFENAKRLDENGNVGKVSKSIIENIKESNKIPTNLNKGITGFGWAIRREDIEKIKFLDTQIIGGADSLMFFSFVGLNNTVFHKKMNNEWLDFYNKWYQISFNNIHSSINNISGDIIHLYHGKMINRNYNSRYEILSKDKFNPILDLIIDNNNLWKFKNVNICENLEKYFESRNEDDNIIDINTYFDNIYVINLDRIKDRYEKIKYKLEKLNIKFERFSAIDGNNIKDDEYDFSRFIQGYGMLENKYALACLRSHIDIIKDAKFKGYKRILIFEDDALISKDINIHLQKLRNIKDWKLLYLGSSQYNWNLEFIEDFYYSRKTLGCFSYAIDESIYDEILELNKEELSIDNLLLILQSKYYKQCYTFYPNICIADVSESTIRADRDQDSHSKRMRWNLLKNYI
jgi:GR25 family glycosyltransferase involved in LPS biosynthesis